MKQSIFYLDDEVTCLSVFEITFGGDYDVQTATTLADARRMLAARPFNIVISDQCMPEMEGSDFLREVAEKYPASRRVMLTGTAHVGNILHQLSNSIVEFFIIKPWTRESVQHVLERAKATLNRRDRLRDRAPVD